MHAAARAAATLARRRPARAASTTAADVLASLVNHERSGLPAGAGVAGPGGFDLARMHRLLAALGNPHASLRAVHVVGSKGKGSVAAMLACAARAAGLKVGLYTSPHVVSPAERVWIDGAPMPTPAFDAVAAAHAGAVAAAAAAERGALSWFEAATALALRAFADAGVDLAVLEAGVGGATDATNVFQGAAARAAGARPPLCVVAAPVTNEHAAVLGGDVASIAATKAGVLSGGAPLVVGEQPHAEAAAALAAAAGERGSPLVDVAASVRLDAVSHAPADAAAGLAPRTRVKMTVHQPLAAAWGTESVTLSAGLRLFGDHQASNAATAAAAAATLAARGLPGLTPEALVQGLETARLPGRFQTFAAPDDGVAVVVDGAHTPASAAALAAAARAAFPPPAPLALVLATAADKDAAGMAAALRPGLAPVAAVFTETSVGGGRARAAAPGALVAAWQAAPKPDAATTTGPVRCRELIKAGMAAAVDAAAREVAARGSGGAVIVAGSLAGAGDAVRSVRGLVELE